MITITIKIREVNDGMALAYDPSFTEDCTRAEKQFAQIFSYFFQDLQREVAGIAGKTVQAEGESAKNYAKVVFRMRGEPPPPPEKS